MGGGVRVAGQKKKKQQLIHLPCTIVTNPSIFLQCVSKSLMNCCSMQFFDMCIKVNSVSFNLFDALTMSKSFRLITTSN